MAAVAGQLCSELPADVPVLLPAALPSGWGLAAPYIAGGDGSALPNPETWPNGYRAAFTDGESLVTVSVNPERGGGKGSWTALDLSIAGRAVSWRHDGETTVLATRSSRAWRVAVTGVGVRRALLEHVAESLSDWRAAEQ